MSSQGSAILTIGFVLGFGSDLAIAQTAELRAKTILFVTLSGRQGADLKPGAVVQGQVARIFGHPQAATLEGSGFEGTVAKRIVRRADPGSRRGFWSRLDHWLFDPSRLPAQRGATFESARITKTDGTVIPVAATAIDTFREQTSQGPPEERRFRLVVELERPIPVPDVTPSPIPVATVIRGGTEAHLVLAQALSSSGGRPGEEIRAYLLDPIERGSERLVPSGAVFVGRVAARPPRRFWRGGRMQLSFTKLVLPDGGVASVSVSISGLPPSRGLRAHLGPEGALMSRKPGVSSVLRQVGSTYALGKLSDDLFEEGIKAAVSHLSSGAVAASARYVGLAAGATWVCAQRGRDAYVPAFSKLNVTFNRDTAVQ